MHDTPPISYQIWYAMSFLKVKDGHLIILTDLPLSLILARASKLLRSKIYDGLFQQ